MLRHIRATFQCDRCGKDFSTTIAPPYKPPWGWCMFDVAEDSVRWGSQAEGPTHPESICSPSCSVEGDRHLCASCTFLADMRAEAKENARR